MDQHVSIGVAQKEFLLQHVPQFSLLAERAGDDYLSQLKPAFTGLDFDVARFESRMLFPEQRSIAP